MTVRIYTFAGHWPDFLVLQKRTFDRFLGDDCEFVVDNYGPSSERRGAIYRKASNRHSEQTL